MNVTSCETTAAISQLDFISPVRVGSEVCCYARLAEMGTSSMRIKVEVWTKDMFNDDSRIAAEGVLVFVAIDSSGIIHKVPTQENTA